MSVTNCSLVPLPCTERTALFNFGPRKSMARGALPAAWISIPVAMHDASEGGRNAQLWKPLRFSRLFVTCAVLRCSVMSNSLQTHGLQPTRLFCPQDFPSKNTGVGQHFLLLGTEPSSLTSSALADGFFYLQPHMGFPFVMQ